MEKINSEIIHTVKSEKFGTIGHLVIDKLIDGGSFGGVRIIPNEQLSELQLVAKSMTYKNAFIGNKTGGAKAAIIINEDNNKYRNDIIVEFGKSISPFIKNGKYFPVMDMGIYIEELQTIYDSAGHNCDVLSWKNTSHEYTAYSCFYATLCALEKKHISIKDATFSVQGFGNVGSAYANLMCKNGARLVAISNKYSGMIKEDGLDIGKIIKGR
jgi:glutamate dehydrogenase/leucine dehydrogenase